MSNDSLLIITTLFLFVTINTKSSHIQLLSKESELSQLTFDNVIYD